MKRSPLAARVSTLPVAAQAARKGRRQCDRLYARALVACGLLATSWSAVAAETIALGSAQSFSVLGGSTVTNAGTTIVVGNLGVSPGSAVTGFPPGMVQGGSIHAGDPLAAQAHTDASTAYAQVSGEGQATNLSGMNLGGLTLQSGVYHFDTAAQLTGTLTLNTGGNPNAAFHFQVGTSLTTGFASSIVLLGLNGAAAPNVFWQVGSSATLGVGSVFDGNILALTSITLDTGASLSNGRALALNGAITLDSNAIDVAPPVTGRFWGGGTSNLWSGANWSPDAFGAVAGTLAPAADVVFSVTGVAAQNQNTILDANAVISSLTVNDPVAVTISGPHVLSIVGTGAAHGIAINPGAGLTTINSGLMLGPGSQTILVNNAAGLRINGVVSGANGLVKTGAGLLALGGANAYTGMTEVAAGTVQAVAPGVIPKSSAVVIQPGAALNLGGFNQSVGSVAGAGAVGLGSAQLETGNDNQSTTYAGAIGGAGTLRKVGAGTLVLTGHNTYTGATTLAAGGLEVDGAIAGNAEVAGGTLRGTGSIGGSLVNAAAVNPGRAGSPGTLNVEGNFTQRFPGTLGIRLASPTSFDRLVLGGSAMLGGVLNLSYLNGFEAKPGEVFQILAAGKGVTGRFSEVDDAHAAAGLLKLSVVYERNDVLLEFIQSSFAGLAGVAGLTPNEVAVARALDRLAIIQPNNSLVRELDALPLAQLRGALSLLSPEDFAAIFSAGLSTSQVQMGNLERRLEEVRQGSTGFSDSGFAITDSHGASNFDGKSDARVEGKDAKETPVVDQAERRWGFFISGSGDFGDLETTGSARGSSFTTGGVTVGADYRVSHNLVLGVALGYANTSSALNRGGSLDIDRGQGSLYGTFFTGGFYLDGIIGGGYGSYETRRRTLGGIARGETEGADFNGSFGAGYDVRMGALTVGPIAAVQYSTVGIDHYDEHNTPGALRIASQSQDSLRSTVGLKATYAVKLGHIALLPEVRAQWEHEFLTTDSSIDAGFDSDRSFTVYGPHVGRDGLLLDVGASAQLTRTTGIFAYYTGELGRENYTVHSVNGGLRVSF